MAHTWRGVYPAVTTQFHKDESLDLETTAAHIEQVIASGVSGLVMLGSLGENNMLLPAEKQAVLRCALEVSNGRVPVLSGVSELSTAIACDFFKESEKNGVDGFMLMPAMVYPADKDEAVYHFRTVAAATGLPIIVYNNPIAYKVDLTPETMLEMSDVKNFVAIKESSGDTRRTTDMFNKVGDRYAIFAGVDDLIFECVALGAVGWIAGIGLGYLKENQYLWDLMIGGKWDEARALYRWFTPLMHLDVGPKFVQKIKLAIKEQGMGNEWVRAPRRVLAGQEREETLAVIRHADATRPSIPERVA